MLIRRIGATFASFMLIAAATGMGPRTPATKTSALVTTVATAGTTKPVIANYACSTPSPSQGIQPIAADRGQGQGCGSSILYALGMLLPTDGGLSDLDGNSPPQTPGPDIICGASYNGAQETLCAGVFTSDGPQGFNWFQSARPELVFSADTQTPAHPENDTIRLVFSATRVIEFGRSPLSSDLFVGVNGTTGAIVHHPKDAMAPNNKFDWYEYRDRSGLVYTFIGGAESSISPYDNLKGQLWKVCNANGDTGASYSYVSDTLGTITQQSAIDGYYVDTGPVISKRVHTMFNSAGRKYTFGYGSVNATDDRLTEIKREEWTGSAWAEVARVNYTYYTSMTASADLGSAGDLMMVTRTVPLTSGGSLATTRFFAYYTDATYDDMTNPGNPHQIKLTLSDEGYRRYVASSGTPAYSATSAALKPFSSLYATYYDRADSTAVLRRKVKTLIADGDCGCSGAPNGQITLSYEANPNVLHSLTTYDGVGDWAAPTTSSPTGRTQWATRTTVAMPYGGGQSYKVMYFDEWSQLLGQVEADDSSFTTNIRAAKFERDADGRILRVYSPDAVTSYTHTISTSSTYIKTSDATSGLVTYYDYYAPLTGDNYLPGSVPIRVSHSDGFAGSPTKYIDSETDYLVTGTNWYYDFGTGGVEARIGMPIVKASRMYRTNDIASPSATDYDETGYAYTFWTPTSGFPSWNIQKVVTTPPKVSIANNGSNSTTSTTTETYVRTDGRVQFSNTADGRWTYYGYDDTSTYGTADYVVRTEDVDQTSASPITTAATAFGVTLPVSGALNITTQYSHDSQGRMVAVTMPNGRVAVTHFSQLMDGRPVVLSVPNKVSTTYYGPVEYTVLNHSGKPEAKGIITLATSNSASAIGSWILSGSSADPIAAVSATYGVVARLTTTVYNASGSRAIESRSYFNMPSSLPGTGGTHYDSTTFAFNDRGLLCRQKMAAGTVTRTDYDQKNRLIATWIGTNDHDTAFPYGDTSGTSDMTQIEARTYDTGGHLLTASQDIDGGGVNFRVTSYTYDYRGRAIAVVGPVSPYMVSKYDNQGRVIAVAGYSSSSSLASKDPAGSASGDKANRISASETTFDERGRICARTQHMVVQSNGSFSTGDDLATLNWYDHDNKLIKSTGPRGILKFVYDRLDRKSRVFTLAKTDDSAYADAAGVSGDVVLEELLTAYEDTTGNVLLRTAFSRYHNIDENVTGPLDSNADSDNLKITATNLKRTIGGQSTIIARPQITAIWYDALNRPIDTVQYGTYTLDDVGGSSNFNRSGLSAPSRPTSGTQRITTAYTDDGMVDLTTDPRGISTKFVYDNAARKVASIENSVYTLLYPAIAGGSNLSTAIRDNDRFTRYEYTSGLMTKMWVDLDGDGTEDAADQVTQYVYGTTIGTPGAGTPPTSDIATGHLLREAIYPPQTSGQTAANRTVYFAYNALSETIWNKNQNGTELTTIYDGGGRQTAAVVTVGGTNIDTLVQRVEFAYTNRGQIDTVIQYDATTSGNALNGLAYTYDDWGNAIKLEQDHDSDVGGGGDAAVAVEWAYSRQTPSGGRPRVQRDSMTLPGPDSASSSPYAGEMRRVKYLFGTSSSVDEGAGRVSGIKLAAVRASGADGQIATDPVAQYDYLGARMVVGTTLPNLYRASRLYSGSPVAYDALDVFNRVTISRWAGGTYATPLEVFHADISYDEDNNITKILDPLELVASARMYDTAYTVDTLNRLTSADRGTLTGGVIGGATRNTEGWELTQTGNWNLNTLNLNNDGDTTDTDEFSDSRAYTNNNANEIVSRSGGSVNIVHDQAGQMTDDGVRYKYKYDAFGRLVKITDRAGTPTTIAEYVYDGLGQRIGWHYNVDADAAYESAMTTMGNAGDPWYWFIYDDRWRIVASIRLYDTSVSPTGAFRHSSADMDLSGKVLPKERFFFHEAGADGMGGSSYIDSLLLEQQDLSTAWASSADSTCESTHYCLQNSHNDTIEIVSDIGARLAAYRYTAYGKRTMLMNADYDGDGVIDFFDYDAFASCYETEVCAAADWNKDGTVDFFDHDAFVQSFETILSLGSGGLRHLYSGYESDPVFDDASSAGGVNSTYHVRNRVYETELGRWITRDPLRYRDGISLLQYVRGCPLYLTDPSGTSACTAYPDMSSSLITKVVPETSPRPEELEEPEEYRRGKKAFDFDNDRIIAFLALCDKCCKACSCCGNKDCKCSSSCDPESCKKSLRFLVQSIQEAWSEQYTKDYKRPEGEQSVGGIWCYQWAKLFEEYANASRNWTGNDSNPGCWKGEVRRAQVPGDAKQNGRPVIEMHAYFTVSVCGNPSPECSVTFDDGFMGNTGFVHIPPTPFPPSDSRYKPSTPEEMIRVPIPPLPPHKKPRLK